jgi:hypothetical protein
LSQGLICSSTIFLRRSNGTGKRSSNSPENSGGADKFHEIITWFYLITIAERIEEQGTDEPQSFVRTNPDLFATKPSLISQFYSNELIASDRTRRAFLLPQPYQSQSCTRAITSIP